ncbi:MAG: class I SAM-dependent methyltransferase [Arenicellales bacterium]
MQAASAPHSPHFIDTQCPNCGGTGLESIYTQSGVPVHDVVLIESRSEALAFPRGDIRLGYCRHCGFATNTAFDDRAMHYDGRCEETQGASSTFNEYHRRLAGDLVQRYRLHGAHVVEIGCGKGEFLALLCRLGGNRGTGFDPAYVPGRIDLARDMRVLAENFTGRQDIADAGLVCCKMTLEHIRQTREFLRALRRALPRDGIPVFFQVPDAERIYRARAFWDIYYEHCSYFTAPALAALFSGTGFDVEEISWSYGGQYLTVFARSGGGAAPVDYEMSGIGRRVDAFRLEVSSTIARWRSVVTRVRRAGGRTVLWGGGSKAVAFLTALDPGPEVDFVVDINQRKHGTYLPVTAHRVAPPTELANRPPRLVIVMNRMYRREIQDRLAALGVAARLLCLP